MKREVKFIVVHCTQSPQEADAESIKRNMAGQRPVFHGMVDQFGYFVRLLGYNHAANNACPENELCYHLAYVGGLDRSGRPADTRNPLQWHRLYEKIQELRRIFPQAIVVGADFMYEEQSNRDKNPGFDVVQWLGLYATQTQYWQDYEEQEDGTWIYIGEPDEGLLLPLKVFSTKRAISSMSGLTS
ncbi:MAG: hypothetical protein AB1458_12025 [Bacteroidota bacterium]